MSVFRAELLAFHHKCMERRDQEIRDLLALTAKNRVVDDQTDAVAAGNNCEQEQNLKIAAALAKVIACENLDIACAALEICEGS